MTSDIDDPNSLETIGPIREYAAWLEEYAAAVEERAQLEVNRVMALERDAEVLAKLIQRFRSYAQHRVPCNDAPCTCGLSQIMRETKDLDAWIKKV